MSQTANDDRTSVLDKIEPTRVKEWLEYCRSDWVE